MLALTFQGDKKLELLERPQPTAQRDTAVVRMKAAAICGTDLRTYRYGSKKIDPGIVIGHEGVGELVEVGSDVEGFKVGDRVQIAPAIAPEHDYARQMGRPNLSPKLLTIGFQFDGMFAEYMEIPAVAFEAGNVTRIEGDISYQEAALTEPIACVLNGQEFLRIKEGDRVAVFGSGFIGCMHAELAMLSGATDVFMFEPNTHRLAEAVRLNSRITPIDPSETDPVERVKELTGGVGAEVAITACSVGQAQTQAQELAAVYGRISLFGGLPGESMGYLDSNLIHYKELSIHGVHASTPKHNRTVLGWIIDGRIDVKKYISRTYSLESILDAFVALDSGEIMKAVVAT